MCYLYSTDIEDRYANACGTVYANDHYRSANKVTAASVSVSL